MSDTIHAETVSEYAGHFDMSLADAHKLFNRFLRMSYSEAKDQMNPFQRAFCLGVYQTVKLKWACRMSQTSRANWRDRAIELGSAPHLREEQ